MTSTPQFVFTDADLMQPVYCIGCLQHIPQAVSNAGRGLCPDCLAKISGTAATPPAPPVASTHQRAAQGKKSWAMLVAFLVIGAAFLCAVLLPALNGSKAKSEEQNYMALLARLARQNPDKRFALYLRGDETVRMNAQLSDLRVDEIKLERSSGRVDADVKFTSTSTQDVAPTVYVSVWGERGTMLGREKVVGHVLADLRPNASDRTSDSVTIREGERPVIVAVDDDPAGRAAEAQLEAAASAQRQQNDAEFATRWQQVRAIFEARGASVEPWDSSAPRTMRIHLPASVSLDISRHQARELAGMARDRLDRDAIVYIKSAGGQILAKAAPWGFE